LARSRKSAFGLGLRIILWPIPVLVLILLSLGARLAAGPVDVPIPERALDGLMAHAAPGWTMAASGAQFDLFGQDGLTGLKLRDVRLLDPDGAEATAIPELGLTMSLSLSDKVSEVVRIKGVRIDGARLGVTRGADGRFALGIDKLFRRGDAATDLTLDTLFAAKGETSPLPVIALSDVQVDYRDTARGIAMTARGSTVVYDPAGTIRLDGDVDTGGDTPMALDIEATRLDDGTVGVDMVFDDVDPPVLAMLDPALGPLDALRMTLRGSARATLAADATVRAASATLRTTGGGTVVLGGQARAVERLAVGIVYAPGVLRADFHEIALKGGGLSLSASAEVERSGTDAWKITARAPKTAYADPDGTRRATTGAISVAARVEAGRVTIDTLTALAPTLHAPGERRVAARTLTLEGSADPSAGTALLSSLRLDRLDAGIGEHALRADRLTAAVSIGPDAATLREVSLHDGTIRSGGTDVTITRADGTVRLDRRDGRARIDALAFDTLRVALTNGKAFAAPSLTMQGTVDTRKGQASLTALRVPRATVTLPDRYDAPLALEALTFTLDADARSVDVSDLSARVGGVPVGGTVGVRFGDGATRIQAGLIVARTDIARVAALWPVGTLTGARTWMTKNVHGAALSDLSLDIGTDTSEPDATALALSFGFEEGTITAIPGMPPLRRARGRGTVSLDRFDIALASARVAVPGTPGYTLGRSRFSIPDLSSTTPVGQIELDVAGPAQSILRFLDHEPLSLVAKSGLDIARITGDVSGKVKIKLPLSRRIAVEDVDFRADATVRDFAVFEPHIDTWISGESMSIIVDPARLKFRADARIDDLSARLTYRHGFARPAAGQPEGILTVQSYLTREDFARRMGMDVSDHFDGVAVLDAKVDLFPGGGAQFAMSADLTGSTLRIAPLGWTKTDGVPVTVEASGFRNPDGAGQVEKIAVRGSGITARGRIGFAPGGSVDRFDLDRIVLADLLDVGIRYSRGTDASTRRIEIAGAYLDASRAFSEAMESGRRQKPDTPAAQGDETRTEIALRLASVRLRDDLSISDIDGGVRFRGENVMAAKLEGRLNGIAPANLLAERREDGLSLRLTSRDAGAFLGAASVLEGARGGTLRIDARTRDTTVPSRIAGVARANGITLHDSPTMRRILTGGAVGSLAQQMLSGGLSFTKVELPFSGTGGRWAIADGVAWGNALGLTLDGAYDIGRKGIDLTGTVSPAYAINGALGSVPLLGTLLTGGEGEGVFAITFAVRGTTDAPRVWVNPLSAIAPGFLRKIVSGVMDGGRVVDTDPERPRPLRSAER